MGAEQSTPAAADAAPTPSSPRPSALVICGPSGVGKGTLIKRLLDGGGRDSKFAFSVSHTTRKPRPGASMAGQHSSPPSARNSMSMGRW